MSEKLVSVLRQAGFHVPDGASLRRTYAGRHQRSAGAWSWYLVDKDDRALPVGSAYRVSDCLRHGVYPAERDIGIIPMMVKS